MLADKLTENLNSVLRISIRGTFAGTPITGGTIGPVTKNSVRWVNFFHKKGGAGSGGWVTLSGDFYPDEKSHVDDQEVSRQVYLAAVEQYK